MWNQARRSALAGCLSLAILSGEISAADIEPYKLTGVDGHVLLQYVQDEQTTVQSGVASRSRQAQSGIRSEVFVMTHSYIYHPNLMTLDLGGGPVLHNENIAGDSGSNSARGALYNLTARATVLKDKPYTGSLFYSHLNPVVSVAPGQVLTQENTRYGFDFSLLTAASPLPVQGGYVRSNSSGRGAERRIDDQSDQLNLSASKSYGAIGSTQVQYQASSQNSQSGSPNLPVQSSVTNNQAITADTRLQFGSERQYDVGNLISITSQDYAFGTGTIAPLRDGRFALDVRARHSRQLHSHGNYSYSQSTQGELGSAVQAASAGLSYWPLTGLEASFGVRGENNQTKQFTVQAHGLDGTLRYEHALPPGVGQVGYGARYDSRTQQAQSQQTTVLGERLALSSAGTIGLSRNHVVTGSPVVSNAGRTQVFVAGIDYRITVVGSETRLQRLVGGSILEGEQVLVDYAYDVGGSYAYSQLDQTLSLNWNYRNAINAYLRFLVSAPRLDSGAPSFPLNEVNSAIYGVHADLPVNAGLPMTIGGGVEFENRRETLAPYRRLLGDLYIQTDEPIFGFGNLRASLRRSRIEYAVAAQDSDLRGYELRYWSRHWFGIDLTASLGAEREAAGLMPRQRNDGSIGLQWQERKFSLSSSLVQVRETQAGVERRRTSFQFLAKRDF